MQIPFTLRCELTPPLFCQLIRTTSS
jgi:cell division control protein 24